MKAFNAYILPLIVVLFTKNCYPQQWTFTTSFYPSSSSFAHQLNNRFFSYGNVLASLTQTQLILCNYYNGTSTVCRGVGVVFNTGHFYMANESSPIYFYGTRFNMATNAPTQVFSVILVTPSPSDLTFTIINSIAEVESIYGLDIDWSHRWLIVGGATRLFLYDLLQPQNPIKRDTFNGGGGGFHPRGISIYKNLVCSSSGFCVRLNPSTGRFFPNVDGTIAQSRSLRIFDDYILVWNAQLHVYSLRYLLLGSAPLVGGYLDAIRSKDIVLISDYNNLRLNAFNISNPASIQTLMNLNTAGRIDTLFNDKYGIYASYWDIGTLGIIKHNIVIPGGYEAFYNNSEWFDYAVPGNVLSLRSNATNYSFVYGNGSSYAQTFLTPVRDSYTMTNMTILYNITQLPSDYVLERLVNDSWTLLNVSSQFTLVENSNQSIRIRFLNLNNSQSKNLTQTIRLLADNTRGHQLQFDIVATFNYGPGSQCPINATCTASSFCCRAGNGIDSTGNGCLICRDGSYSSSDCSVSSCLSCPENAICSGPGATTFQCVAGYFLYNGSCSICPLGNYCPGDSSLIACGDNSNTTATGSSSVAHCVCDSGYFGSNGICSLFTSSTTVSSTISTLELAASETTSDLYEVPSNNADLATELMTENLTSHFSTRVVRDRLNERNFSGAELVLVALIAGISVLIALVVIVKFILCYRSKRLKYQSGDNEMYKTMTETNTLTYTQTIGPTQTVETLVPSSIGLAVPGYREVPFNSFVVIRKLAKGGGGQIYIAQAMSSETSVYGKEVIVKVIGKSQDELSPRQMEAVRQEISILQLMSYNRHFPKFIGYCERPVSILMKYYRCGSLEAYIRKPLRRCHKLSITSDIAVALHALHCKHIAHCDLKPANVLLERVEDGRLVAVLTDFGIARITSDEILAAKDFTVINLRGLSWRYAAPEVIYRFRGASAYNNASTLKAGDVYAFAMIIYELLNRKAPWLRTR